MSSALDCTQYSYYRSVTVVCDCHGAGCLEQLENAFSKSFDLEGSFDIGGAESCERLTIEREKVVTPQTQQSRCPGHDRWLQIFVGVNVHALRPAAG